ncbi:MAG TPA: reverse transcriptase family protein, partial [Candidatus Angelobacter sp.]
MNHEKPEVTEIERLNILSPSRLAHILGVAPAKLNELALYVDSYYDPFETFGRQRPFQKKPNKPRIIDNPRGDLKKAQRRIYRKLLRPICFPQHVLGGVPKRSVLDNAGLHLGPDLLIAIDVRKCFPTINNLQVYRIWRNILGCSPPVAKLLTRLTTFKRRLPQGSPASPLLANLFIWSIDAPIRQACAERNVAYSTWIDDLAFSGVRAREVIQIAASVLAAHGLRLSRKKIRVMGPRRTKLLTGTRLGKDKARASKDKLARTAFYPYTHPLRSCEWIEIREHTFWRERCSYTAKSVRTLTTQKSADCPLKRRISADH